MFVCLFVLYAFGSCKSQCSQTLHGIPLHPGEGQDGVRAPKRGVVEAPPVFEKPEKFVSDFSKIDILVICSL
jgi:hypothetical protein